MPLRIRGKRLLDFASWHYMHTYVYLNLIPKYNMPVSYKHRPFSFANSYSNYFV